MEHSPRSGSFRAFARHQFTVVYRAPAL